jgi:hypothetical protein
MQISKLNGRINKMIMKSLIRIYGGVVRFWSTGWLIVMPILIMIFEKTRITF